MPCDGITQPQHGHTWSDGLASPPTSPFFQPTPLPQVLNLSFNQLQQLPSCIATFPALRSLDVCHNLLTELPCLPPSLHHLDLSSNRLKALEATDLLRLTALTYLSIMGAFSHRPHGEGSPVVGALARLCHLRREELHLDCEEDIMVMVRTRYRLSG